ncbi:MAG: hypothetical protein M3O82_02190 [Verrucomicrobiota bacterium]|nr:hypothetical protein [Verrucomicrobiota bacterium]
MNLASTFLAAASLGAFLLSLFCWKLTSSRPTVLNLLLSAAFLFFGAYFAVSRRQVEFSYILPFFAAMLCGGRAVGFLLRSRKERELLLPGLLVMAVAIDALIGAFLAYRAA